MATHLLTRIIMDKLKPGVLIKAEECQLGGVSESSNCHMQNAVSFEWVLTNSNATIPGHPCCDLKDILGQSWRVQIVSFEKICLVPLL